MRFISIMEAAAGDVPPSAPPKSLVGDLGEIHKLLTPESIRAFIIGKTSPLKVREDEKKEFGEVFTPLGLIDEMLDKLPVDVWIHPEYKWLDPAAGIGNFPMVVYERLMRGLEPVISDPSERSAHIIRNMLYMAECNNDSCGEITRTFGTAANLFCGDFIKDKVRFKDLTSTFDVIVGNPPYNAPQKSQGKPGGGSTLWNLFVDESLNGRLKPNGYLTFVHPSGWRKPPSACSGLRHMFDNMVHQNYMRYLKIHSKCDGARIFGAQTRFDFYVIERRQPNNPSELTTVVDQTGFEAELDLGTWVSFLPNHSFGLISSLLAGTEQNYVIFSRSQYGTDKKNESFVKSSQTIAHPYPLIHSIVSNGPKIYGTNVIKTSPQMFDISKIIIAESGIRNGVIFDRRGKYGMTQGAFGLRIPDPVGVEGPLMKKALESELFAQIVDAMSFGNFRVDMNMFRYFRPEFYKEQRFQDSPQITSVLKYTKCDDEDEDNDEEECEGGGGAAEMPPMKYTKTLTARKDPPKTLTARSGPGNGGGRTRRRHRHRTTIKLRKYKKQRHTRKKHRLH